MTSETYFRVGAIIGSIVAFITFIGSWWYCAANYGFLLGFGLGWLPAAIAAAIAGALTALLWGVVLLLIGIIAVWAIYENAKGSEKASNAAGTSDPYAAWGDRCTEQRSADGAITGYLCGDVIVPGPPIIVPGPLPAAAAPASMPEPTSQTSTSKSVETRPDEEPTYAQEGQEATNRATGERVVLRDGEWVPIAPLPPCRGASASCKPWERDWPSEENSAPSTSAN